MKMKQIFNFICFSSFLIISISIQSQNKSLILKKGTYYRPIKELKKDSRSKSEFKQLKRKDTVYGIQPIILKENGSFSNSDIFYGGKKSKFNFDIENSIENSIKSFKRFLKTDSLKVKDGKYLTQKNIIIFNYKTKGYHTINGKRELINLFNIEEKGIIINDSTFIIKHIKSYYIPRNRIKEYKVNYIYKLLTK